MSSVLSAIKRFFQCYSLSILILISLSISSVASSAEHVVLQLKWKHQFQFAGFYAAQSQGYFAEEGLDVEIREVDENHSAISTVLSGDADYGVADASLVLSRLRGEPVVILAAIFQHSPLVLLTLQSSNILSPLELKGKQVMYQKNTDDAVLLAMFYELGLKESDHTQLAQSFKEESLLDGSADAISVYSTNQPYYFQQRDIPINIISPANYGIDFYGDMLFVQESYLLENKEQVLAFRRASLKGWAYAISHQQEMVDWIINNLDAAKDKEHLLFEAERTARLIQSELVEIGYFSVNRMSRIANIYKDLGLAAKDSDIAGIDYADYYRVNIVDHRWFSIVGIGLLVFVTLALIFWIANIRLKSEVAARVKELECANSSRDDYLEMINRYVMTARFDGEGCAEAVSKAFCNATGYRQDELIGRNFKSMLAPDVNPQESLTKIKLVGGAEAYAGEMLYLNKRGDKIWLDCEVVPSRDAENKITGFTSVYIDITDKKNIEVLSETDSLTGLGNRRRLDVALSGYLDIANRYGRIFSVILIDLDLFKEVNDKFGHLVGDEILKCMGKILLGNTRNVDLPGRWGGEEFLLICPESQAFAAAALAELLREIIFHYEFPSVLGQTCSFGVAQWVSGDTAESLLGRADKALYKAKNQGRNRVVIDH